MMSLDDCRHGFIARTCTTCNLPVDDDDAVWAEADGAYAGNGDQGTPFHVACLPNDPA